MPNVIIRGDFAPIRMGRYCKVGENSILRPCFARHLVGNVEAGVKFLNLTIGNHSWVGKNCVIEAASVGASVWIGDNSILSKRCIVKDFCWIDDGTLIVEDMVIPPFSIVSGVPGRIVGELPESASVELTQRGINAFSLFSKERSFEDIA